MANIADLNYTLVLYIHGAPIRRVDFNFLSFSPIGSILRYFVNLENPGEYYTHVELIKDNHLVFRKAINDTKFFNTFQ